MRSFLSVRGPVVRAALARLLTAEAYARECRGDDWQFAVEISELIGDGATLNDIRSLVARGFAEHAKETTIPGDALRSFRRLPPTCFPPDTCVKLTATGVPAVRAELEAGDAADGARAMHEIIGPPRAEGEQVDTSSNASELTPARDAASVSPTPLAEALPKPVWDPARRELRYQGQRIKQFHVTARNQELILVAFQEFDWPPCIDDPLPPTGEIEPKDRLRATIKSLNRFLSNRVR